MSLNWLRRILKIRSPTAMILELFSQGLNIAAERLEEQLGRLDRSPYLHLMEGGPFLEAVQAEMEGQSNLWGDPSHRGHTMEQWALILGREYGEALDEFGEVLWERRGKGKISALIDLRSELIQLAAVAGSIVERIDSLVSPRESPKAEGT